MVVVDGGVPHPLVWSDLKADDKPPWVDDSKAKYTTPKVYEQSVSPVSRFRLAPPQPAPVNIKTVQAPVNQATGLTSTETALLSPGEQAIRLKQKGLA